MEIKKLPTKPAFGYGRDAMSRADRWRDDMQRWTEYEGTQQQKRRATRIHHDENDRAYDPRDEG